MAHLQGRVALVIGGSGGIGAASAHLLAEQGASVAITYLKNSLAAHQLLEQIQAKGGTALAIQGDTRVATDCERLVDTVKSTYGQLDILVYSATSGAVFKPFAQISWDEYIRGVHNELQGVFNSTKAILPLMQEQRYGRLVYIGGGLAKSPQMQNGISLGTAKAALIGFVRYIAKEYGRDGITANIVSPGMVETEATAFLSEEDKRRVAAFTPLGRIAQPEDIAQVVAFFSSDASGFMTGTYAPVNGGSAME